MNNSMMENEKLKIKETKKDPFKDKSFYDELVRFVSDEFEARRQSKANYETLWQLSFDFLDGRQYISADYDKHTVDDIPQESNERVVINQIAPIFETRCAKLRQLNKFMTVMSSTSESEDIKSAEISTQILQNTYEQLDMDQKFVDAVNWSEICGSAFLKSSWDNNFGEVVADDPLTNEELHLGGLSCCVVSPFEIYPEDYSKNNLQEQCSIIHARVLTRNELFYKYGLDIKGCDNSVFTINSVSDCRKGADYATHQSLNLSKNTLSDSAIMLEYYEAPTRFYPKGRFIQVCEDTILYYGSLPYRNGEMESYTYPFVKFDCVTKLNSFFGSSVIPRLIPLQQIYNSTQNRINEYLARATIGVPLIENDSIENIEDLEINGFTPGQIIKLNPGANAPKFMETNNLPSDFMQTKEQIKQDLITVSGVSDLSKSSDLTGSVTSGYAIQILQQQDDTRISLSGKNILSALSILGKQWLYLYKQFATTDRVVRYTGISYNISKKWNQNTLTSFDVRVSDDSNMFANSALTREIANQLKADGYIGEDRYSKIMYVSVLKNGDINKVFQEEFLDIKNAEKENYLFNDKLEINDVCPYDDHELHLRQHNIFRKSDWYRDILLKQLPDKAALFDNHCNNHQQYINESQNQPQPQNQNKK